MSVENKFANITAQRIFFDVRTMFYLLLPSETYYEKAEDVPDLTKNVTKSITCVIKYELFSFNYK